MKTLKKVLALTLAAAMIFGLAACGEKKPVVEEKSFSMIDTFNVTTLDYVYNNKSSNGDYTSNFIEGLLTQDSHGTLVPGMAEKWESNADGSVWTFTIRKDAKWVTSQGEEYAKVTAEDFVTGLKHAADTHSTTLALVSGLIKGLAAYADGSGKWEDVGIKADGQTLTYTLNKGCGYFDGMTTYSILWPINADFLASQGDKFGAVDPAAILYNGCFILSSIVSNQEVKFVKNQAYWDKDNVFISDVTVSYTDGKDPAENFNLFVNGEVQSTSINSSLPDVVAKADELYKDNQYKSMTTATSYWGAFNWARAKYALYTNPNVVTTTKNEAEQADTRNAILNKYFRLAVYSAYSTKATQAISKGDERALDAARNTLVPYTFATTSKGESYGALLTKYVEELEPEFKGINLNDGQDAFYNPEKAKTFAEKAKAELGDKVSSWPVKLDYPVLETSTNNVNQGLAAEKAIEDAIGEYVDINLVYFKNQDDYYAAFYTIDSGSDNSIDVAFGAGWGPDYGDPLTYLHCFDPEDGDMLAYSGINSDVIEEKTEQQKEALEAIGLIDFGKALDEADAAVGDERIEKMAYAEAILLTQGIFRSYSTSGANLMVSKIKPFSAAYGLYGQAAYNAVPYFKYMQLLDEPVKAADYLAAKEAWLQGK